MVRDGRGVGRVAKLGQHHRELVAAESGDDVGLAQARLEPRGRLNQHRVARRVPEAVVDGREVVQVDEQNRQAAVVALGGGDRARQFLHSERAVRQVREGIEIGAPVQLLVAPRGGESDRDAVAELP